MQKEVMTDVVHISIDRNTLAELIHAVGREQVRPAAILAPKLIDIPGQGIHAGLDRGRQLCNQLLWLFISKLSQTFRHCLRNMMSVMSTRQTLTTG